MRVLTRFFWCAIALSGAALAAAAATTAPASQPAYVGLTSSNTYLPLRAHDAGAEAPHPVHVEPISDDLRRSLNIPAFYKKTLTVRGMPVIGSEKVSDYACLECAYLIDHMLADSPPWVDQALVARHVRIGIIAVVEYTMDIPENQNPGNMRPRQAAFQDRRSRGLGGQMLPTCAEENLLNLRGDPYTAENITLHEFSHTIASNLDQTRPGWYDRLRKTYQQAMTKGLFASSYSATNEQEYWAEGAQAWFDCAARHKDPTVHSGIWHRAQLKAYDPDLAALLQEVFGDGAWRYVKTTNEPVVVGDVTYTRPAQDLAHLVGLDRARPLFPVFDFNNSPRIQAYPRRRDTSAGSS